MYEDDSESAKGKILHIYPDYTNENYGITESHIPYNYNPHKKHRGHYKCRIKRLLLRKGKTQKKIPRTLREHTEFDNQQCVTTCPNCLNYIKTTVYYYSTGITHTIAASLLPIGMCIIPYYINKYKNAAHYCPRCRIFLGAKYGSGRTLLYPCIKR